eukprot:3643154-Pleurochrysis_carterae.AAC.1
MERAATAARWSLLRYPRTRAHVSKLWRRTQPAGRPPIALRSTTINPTAAGRSSTDLSCRPDVRSYDSSECISASEVAR